MQRTGIPFLADAQALAGYNADPDGYAFANLLALMNGGDGDEEGDEDFGDRMTEYAEVDIEDEFKQVKDSVPDVTGGLADTAGRTRGSFEMGDWDLRLSKRLRRR